MPRANHKYALDDCVCVISCLPVRRKIACTTCENSGKVTIRGEEFECPQCKGECTTYKWLGHKWVITITDARVGKVQIEMISPQHLVNSCRTKPHTVTYMLDRTGVGTGINYDEQDLFRSRERAQAECDRRNKASGILPTDEVSSW